MKLKLQPSQTELLSRSVDDSFLAIRAVGAMRAMRAMGMMRAMGGMGGDGK